jgi:hypothetical protein
LIQIHHRIWAWAPQLEPLGIIKLDEFISDILITTGSKDYLGFIGGKGRNFRKDIAITSPTKDQARKPEWFVFWQPILAQRMIEHWGFQPCDNIEADDACAIQTKYGDMYSKITIASPDKDDLFKLLILGSMTTVKELLYLTKQCPFINFVIN